MSMKELRKLELIRAFHDDESCELSTVGLFAINEESSRELPGVRGEGTQ